jgi:hypothetical protein
VFRLLQVSCGNPQDVPVLPAEDPNYPALAAGRSVHRRRPPRFLRFNGRQVLGLYRKRSGAMSFEHDAKSERRSAFDTALVLSRKLPLIRPSLGFVNTTPFSAIYRCWHRPFNPQSASSPRDRTPASAPAPSSSRSSARAGLQPHRIYSGRRAGATRLHVLRPCIAATRCRNHVTSCSPHHLQP